MAARCAFHGLQCIPRVTAYKRRKVERTTPPGYRDFQCIAVSVTDYSGELELPMHSFLTLSLYSRFVPVEFRVPVSCSHSLSGAAPKRQNPQQSATSTFKFVECTINHTRRIKACKHCRSAKVLPELPEAAKQTSNHWLHRTNALELTDSRRAVSSLQLMCACGD